LASTRIDKNLLPVFVVSASVREGRRIRIFILIIAGLLALVGYPAAVDKSRGGQGQSTSGEKGPDDWPIIVYYPLNDSHSRSWAQKSRDGVIGISYFQRHTGSYDQGTLIYKTISPDGAEVLDSVINGTRLEKSVLLYDSLGSPHIFLARSNDSDQIIDHFSRNESGQWGSDTIVHFNSVGGKFIYEMSAATGPDHSFHLVVLKTRSNIDSDDFMDAWLDSYLFHVSDECGTWRSEIIYDYDMAYTYDMYVKSSSRQDIKVGDDGCVHVVFSQQLYGTDDPSRLLYATNKGGTWGVEVALNYDPGSRDDAGWYPSLCLDREGVPHISCMYVDRVYTHSAFSCNLLLLTRGSDGHWQSEVIATQDDGYYGGDGRNFTGALTHLVFDDSNSPHLVFSDVASTHWPETQALNVGNIRYGVMANGAWTFTTIYRQPLPTDFLHATEMYGMCLFLSEDADSIRVIGQELEITGAYQYASRLVDVAWPPTATGVEEGLGNSLPTRPRLCQNFPNPFNPGTAIEFDLPRRSEVNVSIYNLLGQQVNTLVSRELTAGGHSVYWNGTDRRGSLVPSGVYFCRFRCDDYAETKKMLLLR